MGLRAGPLYLGPLGLFLYVMADKEPALNAHEAFVAPLWKQGMGSTVHCAAGDATGIIAAAAATALLGLPMWLDLLIEYVFGFLFGLLIFQSLFMRAAMGGTYWENVRRTFVPELLSMNAMMAGMAPVMSLLMMGRDMRAMWPGEPLFWFVMSMGVIVGFALAYPVNLWLVRHGLKHGLMTVRVVSKSPGKHRHEQHESQHEHQPSSAQAHKMPRHDAHASEKTQLTGAQLGAVTVFTLVLLTAGMYVPAAFLNLRIDARSVARAIMPPGMIHTPETPAETMRDMAAADPRLISFRAPASARGDRPLAPRMEGGVKVFELEASVIQWNILPYRSVTAYAINHQVPGPRLELIEGDRVRLNYTNHLPDSTTLHWHGLVVPNAMDGPAYIVQRPIAPARRG